MKPELKFTQQKLTEFLRKNVPPLKITKDNSSVFEVFGSKEITYLGKKMDGIYFATVVPKPNDVRLYFFPIYTHAKEFENIPQSVKKCLKGKSCFHIKNADDKFLIDFKKMINKGVSIYKKSNLI